MNKDKLDRNNYTALQAKPRDPAQPFIFCGEEEEFTLLDFWIWSGSDLLENVLRSQLAEYIVTQATGATVPKVYSRWESQDILTSEGIYVEVKSSAYFQSSHQEGPTEINLVLKKHVLGIIA